MKLKEKMNETERENTENAEKGEAEEFSSELREARWAVVSFEKSEAENLSYSEAEAKLDELNRQKVSGLCIVTDEVAKRIKQ